VVLGRGAAAREEREPRGDGVRWKGPAGCHIALRSSRAADATPPPQPPPVTPPAAGAVARSGAAYNKFYRFLGFRASDNP